jgi:hypothetical protein
MAKALFSVAEVARLIESGKTLALAGDERVLRQLPRGNWIGGTTPYFIGDAGGVCSRDLIHVTELGEDAQAAQIARYDARSIDRVYIDAATAAYSLIIIPAQSPTHLRFALGAPSFERFAHRPLIGWIAGIHLDDLGKVAALVFDGRSGEAIADGAVLLHARLPKGKVAELAILNIFEMGEGPDIKFEKDGFEAREAVVGDVRVNWAKWLEQKQADTRLPLVADYLNTRVNVSFQSVDAAASVVRFYAPVFVGVTYRHARPVRDYAAQFTRHVPADIGQVTFSCNCILNYLYSELEGKRTAAFTGPVTFGEIAYQLVNQTLAYLVVNDAAGT